MLLIEISKGRSELSLGKIKDLNISGTMGKKENDVMSWKETNASFSESIAKSLMEI